MPKRTWCVESWRVESWRVKSAAPRAMPSRPRITSIATSGCAAMSGSSRASAAISVSGEAVACASAMGTVAPTAVCATQTAKQFMSHSRHRDGAGLPLAGTDLRRCNGLFANRCWQSTAIVNRSRTVESACIGCNRPAGKLLAGGRVMSDQRRKKNPELNTSRSGIGSAIIWSAVAFACLTSPVKADEGGVSFWLPGLFGSLAAAPQQPGWSLATSIITRRVSAGADVSRAREITIGKIPVNLSANLSANLNATGGSWHCHSDLCVRNAGPGWPVGRRCNWHHMAVQAPPWRGP